MRVIVSGGGTGGHIYPALAIAGELRNRGADILFIGGTDSPEQALAVRFGFTFAGIPTAPLHRRSWRLAADLLTNYRGWRLARKILADFTPAVAIGAGGFVTAPALLAAQTLHIPTLLHEQNVYPGLANRWLAKKAQAVCLTFQGAAARFPHPDRLHHTGLPVRQEILALAQKAVPEQAYARFDIPEAERHIPTLLITGGSQGAQSINRAAAAAYQPLLKAGIRIIHLCGKNNYFEMRQKAPEHPRLILLPYLYEMEYGLAVADLAVARAGASFLAEAAVLGLPAILVPYPYATNDHQSGNAKVWADAQAGQTIKDSDLSGKVLCDTVLSLFDNPVRLQRMKDCALTFAKPRAEKDIADIAEALAKK